MHALSRFLHSLMAASVTFGCRLSDINKALLQCANAIKLIPVLFKPEIA